MIAIKYLSVAEIAKKWKTSERTVRNYCAQGRIPDAFLTGKTWNIPESSEKPTRLPREKKTPAALLEFLQRQKYRRDHDGIYHKIQVDFTYNSSHIEGSLLTYDQIRYIFETNTIGVTIQAVSVDDVVKTSNHFSCIDMVIDHARQPLSERFIKQLHAALMAGTSDSRKDWFAVGDYKKLPNTAGGQDAADPQEVPAQMQKLLDSYNSIAEKSLEDLLDFHVQFESIHPFQDGNGRIGRLIMFKECLRNDILPFIISDELKFFYYRGLREWNKDKDYLTDTCLAAQDHFREILNQFQVSYKT